MPRIVREVDVSWEGNLARGAGVVSAASSGAFAALGFSLPTRVGAADGKTSPEELLAAAHGACFGMSLASELTTAETPPERLDVRCTITMDEVEGKGHQIVQSSLSATGVAPGADSASFARAAAAADDACPFSTMLKAAGVAVELTATYEGGS